MNDLDVAIAVAVQGARVVCERIGSAIEQIDKGAGDFATAADLEAEEAMLAVLRRERPDDAVIAEESGSGGPDGALRRWLVDPLCGTINYAAQMRVVAVNVALRHGSDVMCAAVADPFAGHVFWTDGNTAQARTGDQNTPLVPSSSSSLVDLNFDPPFPSAPGFRTAAFAADPEFAATFRPRVVSSSLALTWVATGQRAGYITDGAIRDSVHFSAGLAICEASGCVVTDLNGGALGSGPYGAIVAADHQTHALLLRLAHKQRH